MVLTIGLDEKTSSELQQIARVRSVEPAVLAQDAIRSFLHAEARRVIQTEVEAYKRIHQELLQTMPGDFVAVHQGQVVDHDADQLALLSRIEATYGGQPVLIRQVRPELEHVITVYSPRIDQLHLGLVGVATTTEVLV
jgi:hypothetical protein